MLSLHVWNITIYIYIGVSANLQTIFVYLLCSYKCINNVMRFMFKKWDYWNINWFLMKLCFKYETKTVSRSQHVTALISESFIQPIHSNGSFIQKRIKWLGEFDRCMTIGVWWLRMLSKSYIDQSAQCCFKSNTPTVFTNGLNHPITWL